MATFKETAKLALASKPFQIVVAVGAVLGIMYLIGRAAGKKGASGVQIDYPKGDTSVPDTWVKDTAPAIIRETKQAVGFFSASTQAKYEAMSKLFVLTDAQLTYIYNAYNKLYYPTGEETLKSDIVGFWAILSSDFNNLQRRLVDRMSGLGMK